MVVLRVVMMAGVVAAAAALPLAAEEAEQLLAEQCSRCHGSETYSRPERRMNSLAELRTQVRNCELMLGLSWFDPEIDTVTAHLNRRYYHFPTPEIGGGSE